MQIPQAHGARVSETIWVGIRHINPILPLAHKHDLVDVYLLGVGSPGPLCPLFEVGSHLLLKLGNVATLLFQSCSVRSHAEDTLGDY